MSELWTAYQLIAWLVNLVIICFFVCFLVWEMRLVRQEMNRRQGINSEVPIFNILLLKSASKDGCRCTPNILCGQKNCCESFCQLAKRHKYNTYEKPFIFQVSIQKVLLRVWEAELNPKLQYRYFWWKSIFVYALIVAMPSERKTACFSKFWQSIAAHAEKLISRLFHFANCVVKSQPSLTTPLSRPSPQEVLFRSFCLASATRAPKRKAFALTRGLPSQNSV